MANAALNEIIRFSIVCSQANQFSQNVVHFKVTSLTAPSASIEEIAGQMGVLIGGTMKALLVNTARYEGVIAQVIRPTLGLRAISTDDAGPGTAGTTPSPSQVCGLLQKRTAKGGRKNRGRFYAPFVSATDVTTTGIPTASYLDRLQDLGNLWGFAIPMPGAVGTAFLDPVIFQREAGTTEVVTSWTTVNAFATQRKRGRVGSGDANPLV